MYERMTLIKKERKQAVSNIIFYSIYLFFSSSISYVEMDFPFKEGLFRFSVIIRMIPLGARKKASGCKSID